MKRAFKIAGLILGLLVAIVLIGFGFVYFKTKSRFSKTYQVNVQSIPVPNDSAAITLGKHVALIKGCDECHGKDFGGNVVIDDPALGFIAGPNLTRGQGGLSTRYASFSDEDYVRAIKHGLNKESKSLKLMPSYEYFPLAQKDLGALIAYLKSLPPVNRQMPDIAVGPMGYVLTHFDKLPLVVAENIDHAGQSPEEVIPQITPVYGKYLAVSCTGCHRVNFKGGDGLIPGSPVVPNITATGKLSNWSEKQFINTLRTGVTPEGKKLDPKFMPWKSAKEYTDIEIKSIYVYLKSLTA